MVIAGEEIVAEAYFDTYPGVWRHGDWVEITEHGGMVMYGRSDATLRGDQIRPSCDDIGRNANGDGRRDDG